jgi:hypothetical protein
MGAGKKCTSRVFQMAVFPPIGLLPNTRPLSFAQGSLLSNGQATTNRFLNRGVFEFGGGIDFRLIRFVGLRAEVRDFGDSDELRGARGPLLPVGDSTKRSSTQKLRVWAFRFEFSSAGVSNNRKNSFR